MTEIALVVEKGDRALFTTLTKRLAEEGDEGRVKYQRNEYVYP